MVEQQESLIVSGLVYSGFSSVYLYQWNIIKIAPALVA